MVKKKAPAKRPKNAKNTGTKSSTKKSTVPRNKGTRKSKGVDPDRLALSKNDILQFCDRVLKKWQQDPIPNSRNIPAMIAVRTGVIFSDEVSLQAIWSEIISWVYQLLYENAQAQARHENQEWAKTFSKIRND
ncbi:MAG: hypothetical protein WA799_05310 [Nitrosotalea sp.]